MTDARAEAKAAKQAAKDEKRAERAARKEDRGKVTETYSLKVTYRGGLAYLPKGKVGAITLAVTDIAFELSPGDNVSVKFWTPLTIPYSTVKSVTVEQRHVSTAESLLGGLNSRQLNQPNNLHFEYVDENGTAILLRVEVLTG